MVSEYRNGDVLSPEEQVAEAMQTLRQYANRGDSFDIGGFEEEGVGDAGDAGASRPTDLVTGFLSNPRQLANSLNLTGKQAENVAAIITGGGAGLGHKYLSKYIGPKLAGAVSGFLAAVVAEKIVGK